jgi:diguanylate cyclase (GGDEF)-like protein
MNTDLTHLTDADTDHAVEIAPRVWWVGQVLPDDVFQCHVYLVEQGDQSVLLDPGSRLTFAGTLRKIEEVVPFTHIRYFVCHHPDPDIAAALPLIDQLIDRPDAVLVTHWRTQALLKHYGLKLPFWLVDEHDWRLPLVDRELRFIFTPYAHFPGAICTLDPATGVVFSSDLFGGFSERPALVAEDESHFESLRPFHEHYMPSRDILDFALSQIARFPIRIIAPQHGSIIPERLVPFMLEKLRHLDCGIYLFARENTDFLRLSRLNQTLREITRTMLLYRDFRDIADQLLKVVQHNLPADRIDYYALLEGGTTLALSHETRFSGLHGEVPPEVARILGSTREEWIATHTEQDPGLAGHRLYADAFGCRDDARGGQILTLPLFSPQRGRADGAALIHLTRQLPISTEEVQVVQQLGMPLQVALEREVIYRTIEAERHKAYQRSIRDSLTGLFTRVYMHDAMERHCSLHVRNDGTPVAAAMIDLDYFKRVNDSFGHGAGDEVLRRIARTVREGLRDSDIPVRLGGEEIVVFLVGASAFGAAEYGERVRRAVEGQPFDLGHEVRIAITVSVGIAEREPGEPLDSLIARADQALYRAKEAGRNRVELARPLADQGAGDNRGPSHQRLGP